MYTGQKIRAAAVALALSATILGATEASAHGGGFGGGLFMHHGPGFGGWGHGWGYGWGHGFGWGGPVVASYGGCFVKRFVDYDGDIVLRRVCY